MYVTKLRIENIRSIETFALDLEPKEYPGWHVLLGANGAGKSSVIRSLALALVGPKEALALRQPWAVWSRQGTKGGAITATVTAHTADSRTSGEAQREIDLRVRFELSGTVPEPVPAEGWSGQYMRDPWVSGALGWFSASFGPYRRFSGGDRRTEDLFQTNPRLAPHLSAFGEDVALTEGLSWLKTLHVRSLEGSTGERALLDKLLAFLNGSGLLPHGATIAEVKSEEILVIDGGGARIAVEQMSDGYRSVLSMIFELLRQMTTAYGISAVTDAVKQATVELPGVIAIDEVDAHLHPSWQRDIGPWFAKCFPQLQFFVTTHSPIICRNARSVWLLPSPGSHEQAARVEGPDLQRLVYGSILDAYGTELFGADVARSDESKEMLAKMAQLNRKALHGKLDPKEKKELQQLRAALPTEASETAAAEA